MTRQRRLFAVIRSRGPAWDDSLPRIDDQVDWAAHAAFMEGLVADEFVAHLVRFERFPGGGHGVLADASERALAVIRQFIASGGEQET